MSIDLQKAADLIHYWKHEHFCPVIVQGEPCGVWTCHGCGDEDEYYLECDEHFVWWVRDPRNDYIEEEMRKIND